MFPLYRRFVAVSIVGALVCGSILPVAAKNETTTASVAVGPQYDTTHVYVSGENIDAFVNSFVATFGGQASPRAVFTVTPTPSKTASQYIQTPVGMLSVFAFQTPIPYGFGEERTGYLVTDMAAATKAAVAAGADLTVEPFDDPIGKDVLIQWAGGVKMQLYWHTKAPSYAPLESIPENRVYVSRLAADKFIQQFVRFSHGKILSDEKQADGGEIGRPADKIRRIRINSGFGKMVVFATDGKLPYPFGREITGYEVKDLAATLTKAEANGVKLLSPSYKTSEGNSAVVQFPGGYVAEIHDAAK
ncbi:glyoxalase [Collimonas sp. NPDC087041]|uniref:glyoxalase n=1 Tax=Collimonas sp. NPDC087041 TaxID=3363960 RepID=UPI0037F4A118